MTNGRNLILQHLPTITTVEAYLRDKGWSKVTPSDPAKANPNVLVYQGGSDVEGNPLTVALPTWPHLVDADTVLSNVIYFLATLEAKSPLQLVRAMSAKPLNVQDRERKMIRRRGSVPGTMAADTTKKQGREYIHRSKRSTETSA